MTTTASLSTQLLMPAPLVSGMAQTVLLVEWIVKQQQQLKTKQRLVEEQRQKIEALQKENEQLKDELDKLKNRSSSNSSVPPSSDQLKKPSDKSKRKKGKKRGSKYDHQGFEVEPWGRGQAPYNTDNCWHPQITQIEPALFPLRQFRDAEWIWSGRPSRRVETGWLSGVWGEVEPVAEAPQKVQQVAELVEQPVSICEYHRPLYQCPKCGWSGYSPMPWGTKEGFSYGGRLCSIVGWLGYGGNLTWRKQEYFVEHVLGVPISQGSLAKMHQWFQESLEPSYQQWLAYVQQPGVRCVDETTYCIDGIKYWLWVATSDKVCALLLAPTRSSAELKQLLGENFEGILSSDCFSAYAPQSAAAKQKCLAHLERDLEALKNSRFAGNREFAERVEQVLWAARAAHRDYNAGKLSLDATASLRPELELQLQAVLDTPATGRWPADAPSTEPEQSGQAFITRTSNSATQLRCKEGLSTLSRFFGPQRLADRIKRHWNEWFTFLTHPEVKPDNNDAERALRPIVVHRKVSGGARSDWGAKLVAQMFSFLETVRLQGGDAIAQLCELLSLGGRSPPGLQST